MAAMLLMVSTTWNVNPAPSRCRSMGVSLTVFRGHSSRSAMYSLPPRVNTPMAKRCAMVQSGRMMCFSAPMMMMMMMMMSFVCVDVKRLW